MSAQRWQTPEMVIRIMILLVYWRVASLAALQDHF